MCRYITDYPEEDVDDALEEGLPDHMLQLVRKGLARATHTQLPLARTQSQVHEDEVKEEAAAISQTLKGQVRLRLRLPLRCGTAYSRTVWF